MLNNQKENMKSYLYVISNKIMPEELVKIGCSEEHPDAVVKYLDLSGASPIGFKLEYQVILNDSYPILQAIRRDLWARLKNAGDGWFYISAEEAVAMFRHEIALCIVDKYRQMIQENGGDNAFILMMRAIDAVLPIYSDSPLSRKNDLSEAKGVSKHILMIMKNENWLQKDRWLKRVIGKNNRYVRRCNFISAE